MNRRFSTARVFLLLTSLSAATLADPTTAKPAANDACTAAAPVPLLRRRDVSRHRFHLAKDNMARERGILDGVAMVIDTAGCMDGVGTRIELVFPAQPGDWKAAGDSKSALGLLAKFVETHQAALQRTQLVYPNALRVIRESDAAYRLGDRLCVSGKGPARIIDEEANCVDSLRIEAEPLAGGAMKIRFSWSTQL